MRTRHIKSRGHGARNGADKSLTPENDVRRNAPDASQLPTSAATATATRLGMRGHSHHHQITIPAAPAPAPPTPPRVLLHPRDQERPRTSQPGVGHIECVFAGWWRSEPVEEPVEPAALARGQTERFRVGHPTESGRTIAKLWPRLWEPIFDVTLIIHKPRPRGSGLFSKDGAGLHQVLVAKPWTGSGLAWRTGHESALPPEAS